MLLKNIKDKLKQDLKLSPKFGTISKVTPTIIYAMDLSPSLGDIVRIYRKDSYDVLGMVTIIEKDCFGFSPFGFSEGLKSGDKVILEQEGLRFPVGEELLGRVLNPLGYPLDEKPPIKAAESVFIITEPIKAMKRGMIDEIFPVGVKTIDGLLTCGKGQKMGIFAGSGVGKSTLMGMIVKGSKAPIKVVALIGERGREVPEFIHHHLGGNLENTVLIAATSDDSALMRKYGAFSAMAVAEYFKNTGRDVLFIMDSVTRFAMAQREIGLALGEPPTTRGYPPSVFTLLPQLMERAGKEEGKGSITAFFTILVDGDDMSDPIADQSRSILDGHIILERALADFGIYPPINILNSASRIFTAITDKKQQECVRRFRRLYALLKENEVLIRIGSYQKGSDAELDEAIDKKEWMNDFIMQDQEQQVEFEKCLEELYKIQDRALPDHEDHFR